MLKNKKIIIVTHVFATGPPQELEEYLKNRVKGLLFIGHPFSYASDIRSFYKRHEEGALVKEKKTFPWKLPGLLMWFKDILYTIFWTLCCQGKFDLYVGADNLNAFTGLFLRQIRKVKKVIFYTIDYVPMRFKNRWLNRFYRCLDSYCVKNCDMTWNLSSKMTKAREAKGLSEKYRNRQIVVPIGISRIKQADFRDIDRFKIGFMGHLTQGKGIEFLIEAMPAIISKVPDASLLVIGTGEMEEDLKRLSKGKGLAEHIEFTGYIEDHDEVIDKLSRCAVAIAPYEDSRETYTRYADPGKIKAYLAAGLPVVVTKVPKIAGIIDRAECGIAVENDKQALIHAICKLLADEELLSKYRMNAVKFIKSYSWDEIFRKAFSSLNKDWDV